MEAIFHTQPNKRFKELINEHISNYEIVTIAVAYMTEGGIKEIEKELHQKRSAKILCGVHGCISDLFALKNLVSQSNNTIEGKVFLGTNVFHPKLYIFQNNDNATLVVGSSNLTGSGLQNNEEVALEITGLLSSQPIADAIKYFEDLWNTNSVSVEKYLNKYPKYSVKRSENESLTSDQKEISELIKKELITPNVIEFENKVNPSLLNRGQQTVPIEFNSIIDSFKLCMPHESAYFDIILPDLPDDQKIQVTILYSYNYDKYDNHKPYYQISLGTKNAKKLRNQINEDDILKYAINLSARVIYISRI